MFDKIEIKPFEWCELDGKTLKILAGKQDGAMVVMGKDTETGVMYVLHEEISAHLGGEGADTE